MLLRTKNYLKQVKLLSQKDKSLLLQLEKYLAVDIHHSKLHTKKLKGFEPDKVFSFRLTRTYRIIFRLEKENIILFAIGHRKDIYN
jgi:mRNA-degrading endonuclease RelE of RelBE toxin-antitoxin system